MELPQLAVSQLFGYLSLTFKCVFRKHSAWKSLCSLSDHWFLRKAFLLLFRADGNAAWSQGTTHLPGCSQSGLRSLFIIVKPLLVLLLHLLLTPFFEQKTQIIPNLGVHHCQSWVILFISEFYHPKTKMILKQLHVIMWICHNLFNHFLTDNFQSVFGCFTPHCAISILICILWCFWFHKLDYHRWK